MFDGIFEPAGRGATSVVHIDNTLVKEALGQFERCSIAQHAFDAICREIERCTIAWSGSGVEPDVEVPRIDMWQTFLRDTVRNFLVMGFSASIRLGIQHGLIVARALHPTETNAFYTKLCTLQATQSAGAAAYLKRAKIQVSVYDAPDFATGELRSAAHRARAMSAMHAQIVDNWAKRDAANSAATIYTSVSKELGTGSGDTSTWFSPRGVSNFQDRDFNSLVAQRELTLSRLESITTKRRENDTGRADKQHIEHIVTDGQAAAMEARALLSQPDGRTMKDQLALAIYKFYNVPPQALGEQVNAERAGVGLGSSSATMTAKTIETFNFTIDRFVAALNKALKAESETPEGSFLELTRPVTADTMGKLVPFLKTKAVIKTFSKIYNIPESDFDATKIDNHEEGDRKQKRTRIEREQAFATSPA